MHVINEKIIPRLSKTNEVEIIVAAYRMYLAEMGNSAIVGMVKMKGGFTLYCLDRVGGVIDLTDREFYFVEFEKRWWNNSWVFVKTMI